jgi:hypothetical protein
MYYPALFRMTIWRLFTEIRGAMTEISILESLIRQFEGLQRYWRSGNMAGLY